MHERESALHNWLKKIFIESFYTLTPLAGDASFRRYFRLRSKEETYVVMDAPPGKEGITSFIDIAKQLQIHGIHTPTVFSFDEQQGFILLEDLGDQLLLNALSPDKADSLYKAAMTTLMHLQLCSLKKPALPAFDKSFMLQELALFHDWFLQGYLSLTLNAQDERCLEETFHWLTTEIATQPNVFIHRDYHSRNLIIIDEDNSLDLGVIDFQDAMRGPYTYDLVSLLEDSYIQWPRSDVLRWITFFYEASPIAQTKSLQAFIRAFDLCGLQRHLKVLGIFCRLHLRDHKTAYLRDLPLTLHYVHACLENYPELTPFYHFMQERVYQPFLEKQPL